MNIEHFLRNKMRNSQIQFTVECESKIHLPFLDVLIEKQDPFYNYRFVESPLTLEYRLH